jgi:hypothetical protein
VEYTQVWHGRMVMGGFHSHSRVPSDGDGWIPHARGSASTGASQFFGSLITETVDRNEIMHNEPERCFVSGRDQRHPQSTPNSSGAPGRERYRDVESFITPVKAPCQSTDGGIVCSSRDRLPASGWIGACIMDAVRLLLLAAVVLAVVSCGAVLALHGHCNVQSLPSWLALDRRKQMGRFSPLPTNSSPGCSHRKLHIRSTSVMVTKVKILAHQSDCTSVVRYPGRF